jgi:tetratricopeptide (TPR) repeat protein
VERARFCSMKRVIPLILLSLLLSAPPISRSQEERVGLRLIAVRTAAEAATLRAQIQSGVSFEALAKAHSIDASASVGGYMGLLHLSDLKPEFQRALDGLLPGRISQVTPVDGQFLLLMRLNTDEVNWTVSNNAGLQAFDQGRYEEAAQSFRQAVQYAEKLTPVDYRLEDSLHGLAEAYRLQKKYTEAGPFYRRYIAAHWGGPSAPEVLDRFSTLIAVAYFRDNQFAKTLQEFEQAVRRAPLGEELYKAMGGILFKAQLIPEAEALLVHAAQLFPTSKDVRYRLAQLYLSSGKVRKALEAFEQLTRMKAPAGIDPALDRLQQSVVYQKIGSIRGDLLEFDAAISAYRKALELMPDNADSRLGLGDIYLRKGASADAVTEFNQVVVAEPQNVAAHFRIADANLRMDRFSEAAEAAAKVLAIDPGHRRAHYVQATALLRMDRKEEGERVLETYRKLEAEARAETDRSRNIVVLNLGAAAKLLEGRPDEALELFRMAIESYPDAPAHYLNLGTAQSKLGRHEAAVETFQKMLSLGMVDNFLVYRNLAREYQLLGDNEASLRHEVVYLQNIDVALQEALDSNLE